MNKKSIKKMIALLCAAMMMAFCLTACTTKDDKDNGTDSSLAPSDTGGMETSPETASPNGAATETPDISPSADTAGGTISGAKPGTYTATAKGYASDITVTVIIADNGTIDRIDADASGETENIGQVAAPKICDDVVKNQSLAVDGVSGATYTSTAVLTAIKDALKEAGVDTTAVTQ